MTCGRWSGYAPTHPVPRPHGQVHHSPGVDVLSSVASDLGEDVVTFVGARREYPGKSRKQSLDVVDGAWPLPAHRVIDNEGEGRVRG